MASVGLRRDARSQAAERNTASMKCLLLVVGPSGGGKTTALLRIIENNPGAKHFALAMDEGLPTLLEREFPHVPHTILDYVDGKWAERTKTGDFLTVCRITRFRAAEAAQVLFEGLVQTGAITAGSWVGLDGWDQLYDQQRGELLHHAEAIRKKQQGQSDWEAAVSARGRGSPLMDQNDWEAINSFHLGMLDYYLQAQPAHVCATALIEELGQGREAKGHKDFAEEIHEKVKISGQKKTGRRFAFTLRVGQQLNGDHFMREWKTWGREGYPIAHHNPPITPTTNILLNAGKNNFWARCVELFDWQAT